MPLNKMVSLECFKKLKLNCLYSCEDQIRQNLFHENTKVKSEEERERSWS